MGKYKLPEFWVFSVPMYLIRFWRFVQALFLSSQCNLRQKSGREDPCRFLLLDATLPRRIDIKQITF